MFCKPVIDCLIDIKTIKDNKKRKNVQLQLICWLDAHIGHYNVVF